MGMAMYNGRGQLKTTAGQVACYRYDDVSSKFYRLVAKVVDNVLTNEWEETTAETEPLDKQFDPVSKKFYVLMPKEVEGVMTDIWVEVP